MLFTLCISLMPRPARRKEHTIAASRTNTGVQAAGVHKAINTGYAQKAGWLILGLFICVTAMIAKILKIVVCKKLTIINRLKSCFKKIRPAGTRGESRQQACAFYLPAVYPGHV